MTEFRDWQITLPFDVPVGDVEGVLTEALFEAAVRHAPGAAVDMTARADAEDGKVWVVFTLVDSSGELARDVAARMQGRISESVLSIHEADVIVG
jgi:hypothetical protein